MKRLIVVDVSNYIFRAFYAIRPLNAPDGTPVNAVYGVLTMFLKLLSQYRPTHILMARDTSGGSFRNQMYSEYKANRTEPPEDLIPQFSLIKELIDKMELPEASNDNFEADDIIGSAVTQWKDHFDEILIASGDKDLMQFIGGNTFMLDTMKDKKYDDAGVFEKMGVRPDQIVDYLSMVGDSSDNIPGMRGIGAKGAAKLLLEHDTLEKCIELKDTFTGKKLTTAFGEYLDDGLLSKKLIQIVTDIDLKMPVEKAEIKFYPSEELITFLTDLGFKSAVNKLEDLKKAEYHAEGTSEEVSVAASDLEFNIEVINNKDKFEKILELLDSVDLCSLHTEYSCGDIFARKISSCTLSVDGKNGYYMEFLEGELDESHSAELLKRSWSTRELEIASEHWKRDCFFAQENNIDLNAEIFDVTQVHYILDGGSKHDIVSLARKYFDTSLTARNKKDPFLVELSQEERAEFCGSRACVIFSLISLFKNDLKAKDLEGIYYDLDKPTLKILSSMEREGIEVDFDVFETLESELETSIKGIEKEIAKYTGGEAVNLNSPKQVGELLFTNLELPVIKKTKTGFSTDSEVLEKLSRDTDSPVPDLILKYRESSKLLSTYVKVIPKLTHPKDGRVHAHFNQHIAVTGRLASNNPNLQNIPIKTEMGRRVREGFRAKKDHLLLAADYSQIELRLLAHFSEDPTMVSAFQNYEDIHRQTASEIMGVKLSEVTSEDRSKAKAVNFGLMYGQSSFGLAAQLLISRSEAKQYIDNYFKNFSRVKAYLDSLKEVAEEVGFAQTLSGRKRFLPDIHSKNRTVKAMAERMAVNSPIQGTAADIIKIAMLKIDQELSKRSLNTRLIIQVHDELVFEVPKSELDEIKKIVKESMEGVVDLKVPLLVDMEMGKNWYALEDIDKN
jgi:DNA polymerase-1